MLTDACRGRGAGFAPAGFVALLATFAGCAARPAGEETAPPFAADPSYPKTTVTILQESAETPIRYRLGDRETKDLDELARWLARARELDEAAHAPVIASLYVTDVTPLAEVERVLDEFAAAGFWKVDVFAGPELSKRALSSRSVSGRGR